MGNEPQRRRSKRQAGTSDGGLTCIYTITPWYTDMDTVAYDEQDGDFVFTRGAKRAKTSAAAAEPENPEPEPVPSRAKKTASARATKATSKKPAASPPPAQPDAQPVAPPQPQPTRRSSRRSSQQTSAPAPAQEDEEPQLILPKARTAQRRTTRASLEKGKKLKDAAPAPPPEPSRAGTPTPMEIDRPNSPNHDLPVGQKIALPFSDTPVINRNKDFRKKGGSSQRRSSLGMRGRRASSLMENGHSAIPHREVDASEFYKHIEDGMLEPRRMRQLLTWCGERALSEKPPHGSRGSSAVLGGESAVVLWNAGLSTRTGTDAVFSARDTRPAAQGIRHQARVFGLVR